MRRTLFVVPRDDVPLIQAAASTTVESMLRRLVSQLNRNGTQPPVDGDLDAWVCALEVDVEGAFARRGAATGAQLAADVPTLTTLIAARTSSERPQRVTTPLLTLMSAAGRLVRATPTGRWTSRHHRWEPTITWWPHGLPAIAEADAQHELAHRWLARFGPATAEDAGAPPPVAALLPALDPTPMGWKHRDWFLGIDPSAIFDRTGNIGPTLWWDGEIIGSWAITPSGDIRTAIVADRGHEAGAEVELAAAQLHDRLDGAVVTPAVRTPLELSLTQRQPSWDNQRLDD